MDFNDINSRLDRLYKSIGERFDPDLKKHLNIQHFKEGNKGTVRISFDKNYSDAESLNKIFSIIEHLAKLKDHLKNKLSDQAQDPNIIETEIDNSDYLKLIMDLNNEEKHGYPLTKTRRSGKDPIIDNVVRAVSISAGPESASSFTVNPFTGEMHLGGNVTTVITGDVKDGHGAQICRLDELINESLKSWKEIIEKYNLND